MQPLLQLAFAVSGCSHNWVQSPMGPLKLSRHVYRSDSAANAAAIACRSWWHRSKTTTNCCDADPSQSLCPSITQEAGQLPNRDTKENPPCIPLGNMPSNSTDGQSTAGPVLAGRKLMIAHSLHASTSTQSWLRVNLEWQAMAAKSRQYLIGYHCVANLLVQITSASLPALSGVAMNCDNSIVIIP